MKRSCPHGDPTCPCQDGLVCHYEGVDASVCSNLPPWFPFTVTAEEVGVKPGEPGFGAFPIEFDGRGDHCHVEGCRWGKEGCGLAKLGIEAWKEPQGIGWACGSWRLAELLIAEMEQDGIP